MSTQLHLGFGALYFHTRACGSSDNKERRGGIRTTRLDGQANVGGTCREVKLQVKKRPVRGGKIGSESSLSRDRDLPVGCRDRFRTREVAREPQREIQARRCNRVVQFGVKAKSFQDGRISRRLENFRRNVEISAAGEF